MLLLEHFNSSIDELTFKIDLSQNSGNPLHSGGGGVGSQQHSTNLNPQVTNAQQQSSQQQQQMSTLDQQAVINILGKIFFILITMKNIGNLEALSIEGAGMQQSYVPQLGGLQLGPGSQYPLVQGSLSGAPPFSQQPPIQYQDNFFMSQMVQHSAPSSQIVMGGAGAYERAGSMAPGAPISGGDSQSMVPGSSGSQQQMPPPGAPGIPPPQVPALPQFQCPPRPNHGVEGRAIVLRYSLYKIF